MRRRAGAAAAGLVALLALFSACGERESTPARPTAEPGVETPRDAEADAPHESGADVPIESEADAPPESGSQAPPATPDAAEDVPTPGSDPVPAPAPPPVPIPEPEPTPAPRDADPPSDPAPAAISLDELADQIKATRSIGVFTKLALKNDIDDLLAELTAYHDRGVGQLGTLERRYEALVLKLLTLLESGEPDLALALARSREAIWSRLADPVRFAEINT